MLNYKQDEAPPKEEANEEDAKEEPAYECEDVSLIASTHHHLFLKNR
jgi:hypothetical protein